MKRKEASPIGDLVQSYLRRESLDTPLNEFRLVRAWNEILGPVVAKSTKQIFIKNQQLNVHLDSAALRHELLMRRTQLIDILNRHIGAKVIYDIRFW